MTLRHFIFFLIITSKIFSQEIKVFVVEKNVLESDLRGFLYHAKNLNSKDEKKLISLKNQFVKVRENVANFGNSEDENWIYFEMKNANLENDKFVLFIDQTFLSYADFYLFQKDSLITKFNLNDNLTSKNKPFGQNNFSYIFQIKHNGNYSIFLRLKANSENGTSKALLILFDENSFFEFIKKRQISFGILVGFLLLSFTVGLILFFNSLKPIYLIYTFYILIVLLNYLSNYGYLNGIFGNNFLGSAKFYQSLLMLGSFFQIHFIRLFLSLPTKISKKNDYIIIGFSAYFLITAVANFIFPISTFLPKISRISLIFLAIFIFLLIFWSIYRKEKAAKFYLFAMLPGLFLTTYLLLSALKVLPIFQIAFTILMPISVYEITIFGFGLVYIFTKEKEKIERELALERQLVADRIIEAQDQERKAIAQNLHDDLGSTLSLLNNLLSHKNEKFNNQLATEFSISEKAVNDLRQISHDLMPSLFLEKGLKSSIETHISQIQSFQNIEFLTSGNERKLGFEQELSIFRIVKELLNNAIKHAKSKKIQVQLIYFDVFLYVSVEDDGIGFGGNKKNNIGIGLKNLNLRVNYLKGKINQETSEKGTMISIEIPYEPNHRKEN